jgi:ketosteroid isomerase-like protein
MSLTETVQKMYAAFGRGDIPAILAHLSPDVAWDATSTSTDVPWLQPRRGPAQVAQFFADLGALRFEKFQPTAILEHGHLAVALVDVVVVVKANGRRIVEDDETHVFRFDADGRVVQFRHRVDTHLQLQAWRGA